MTFEQNLCKILYHDWVKKYEWTYCDRCNKKYNYYQDWDAYCKRSDRKIMGHLLLHCGPDMR